MIELMIVIAIIAIASSLAIPSFNSLIQNKRITDQADNFFVMLKKTRNNAITTNTPSFLCRSSQLPDDADDLACNLGANADRNIDALNGTPDWNAILYSYTAPADLNLNIGALPNDDLQIQNLGLDNDEEQIALQDIREQGNSNIDVVSSSNDINVLAFNNQGALVTPAPMRFAICDDRGEQFGKLIEVNAAGQVRLTSPDPDDDNRDCTPTAG